MSVIKMINCSNDAFSCEIKGALAVIRLKHRAFDLVSDLDLKEKLFELLSRIERAPDLKALMVINSSEYAGYSAYIDFLTNISEDNSDKKVNRL